MDDSDLEAYDNLCGKNVASLVNQFYVFLKCNIRVQHSIDLYPIRILIGYSDESISTNNILRCIDEIKIKQLDEWYMIIKINQVPGFLVHNDNTNSLLSISDLTGIPKYAFNMKRLFYTDIAIELVSVD